KGMGLGLALCHHVVKAHGGRIAIESAPDQGTTVSISLSLQGRGSG
ncbi:MAG: ATP-binding protein, partial [bacterium]